MDYSKVLAQRYALELPTWRFGTGASQESAGAALCRCARTVAYSAVTVALRWCHRQLLLQAFATAAAAAAAAALLHTRS
jgi:hypothetical protein